MRPTSDRLRETLFNIIALHIEGSRFLDICAGSGAVALEALSRRASEVTLIDNSSRACAVISANLKTLGITDDATVINRDALAALARLEEESKQFDIVFLDPPYDSDLYTTVMQRLATTALLSDDSIVIVEHRAKTPPDSRYAGLKLYREVKQGESAIAFYKNR